MSLRIRLIFSITRISLRMRLIFSIVAVVMLAAVALSALHLDTLVNSLTKGAFDRATLAGQQVKSFVDGFINENSRQYGAPSNRQEMIELWNQIITSDPTVSARLLEIMAPSPAILEINVAGRTGEILASSNPSRIGEALPRPEMFSAWRDGAPLKRWADLFVRRPDFQVTVPLGQVTSPLGGADDTIFTIQIVTSSVLLRSALIPDVEWLAAVSGGALLAALLLTALATNWVLRPLRRIEQTIDRIAQGKSSVTGKRRAMAKEFAAVESKLNLLGEQYRGAREEASKKQHSLDELLERMATQLDVATRLAAISRISGGVAHEIKNPLNAISLRLDLLRARLGAPEEELAPEIDILSKEVRRLDRVVKTFLDFTRPVEVKLKEVDLAALAREVTELMTPQARVAHIALDFEGTENNGARIRGDADILKQAILNLVTNAMDAMSNERASKANAANTVAADSNAPDLNVVDSSVADSGAGVSNPTDSGVDISNLTDSKQEAGHLHLKVSNSAGSVRLEVADDGPGIPKDLRDKVFQLYFTTKKQGSGIGLAMTYRAVQLHNGTIDFKSEDGGGTTFYLQFPALVGHA
jgi:signal transduction histidine kinase